ncbi:MAG: response regulator [Acidimicrobiales bacterium]
MRLLLIEDDLDTIDVLKQQLQSAGVELSVAESRDGAVLHLEAGFFDLVICDLNIPTADGILDGSVDHGMAVLSHVRSVCPGTPVIGFSAYGATPGLLNRLLGMSRQEDFLGVGTEQPVLNFLDKIALDECVAETLRVNSEITSLASIEISTGFHPVDLSGEHRRVLQIYARRRGGRMIKAAALGGGLSDARVLRVRIEGEHGEHVASLVAKLGRIENIDDERNRYLQEVAGSLRIGACPGLVGVVRAGAGALGGLFYELAGEFPESLFDVLLRSPGEASTVVSKVAEMVKPWRDCTPVGSCTVAELREPFVGLARAEEELAKHGGALEPEVESATVQTRICLQHGDMHGLNVLVGPGAVPLIIDFGEVRKGPAATDPVVLELSVLFHPDAPDVLGGWPTAARAETWFDLDDYVLDCPVADFVRACRTWACHQGVAAGDREVAAAVYGFALRQLKYDETDKELALAIYRAAGARLRG